MTSRGVLQLVSWVSQDGSGSAGLAIDEDECRTVDPAVPLPIDGEIGVSLFEVDGLGLSVPSQLRSEPIRRDESHCRQPCESQQRILPKLALPTTASVLPGADRTHTIDLRPDQVLSRASEPL